jgi:DNA-binding beta-propeller fold protein YncE
MTTGMIRNLRLPLLALLIAGPAALAAPTPAADSLWVSDDINLTIYNIAMDATVLSSFHSGSISGLSLSVDPIDGTLWAAKEGSGTIEHYTKAGTKLGVFSCLLYDPLSKRPEGVAVDFDDGTLWIVDDETNRVYNIQRNGTPISSFPTAMYDAAASSPQDLAFDPLTDTLWFTDNHTRRIYNVTRAGVLVSTFHATAFSAAATNLQGIGVDMVDGTLWITDRDADAIFNVTRTGVLLGTIPSAAFGSSNPTGVAHDRAVAATKASLTAEVAAGVASGKISAKANKHFAQVFGQIDKQLAKGNPLAASTMLLGLRDYILGKIGSGDIDAAYGVKLAMSVVSLSSAYKSAASQSAGVGSV